MKLLALFSFFVSLSHCIYSQNQDSVRVSGDDVIFSEDYNKGLIHSSNQALFGHIPGMLGSKNGANPNQDIAFTYRGINTISGNLEPQNYIDGIPVIENFLIDPLLIQSSTIMNNSGSANYGLFSGSGVLEHELKSKYREGFTVAIDQQMGIEHYTNPYEVLNADEFLRFTSGQFDGGKNTDWYKEVTQTGLSSISLVELAYNTELVQVSTAISHRNVKGTLQETGYEQTSVVGKVRFSPFNWITLEGSLLTTDRKSNVGDAEIWHGAFAMNPTNDPEDFPPFFHLFGLPPALLLKAQERQINYDQDLFAGGVLLKPIENLSIKSQISGTYYSFNDLEEFEYGTFSSNRNDIRTKDWIRNWNEIKYEKDLFQNAELVTSIFHEFQKISHDESNLSESENRNPIVSDPVTIAIDSVSGSFTTNALGASLGFRNERISFLGTYKNEISANYGEDVGRASFYGIDASYAIFKNFRITSGLSKLGLMPTEAGLSKGSIKKTYFGYEPTDYELTTERVANPNLEWEKTFNFEIGIQVSAFNDKLRISGNYYSQTSTDFIGQDTVGPLYILGSGFLFRFRHNSNFGEIKNQGLEFVISTSNLKLGNIKYQSSTNINYRSSKYIDLSGSDLIGNDEIIFRARREPYGMYRVQEGEAVGNIFAPDFEGIDDEGRWILSTDNAAEYPKNGNGLPSWFFGSYHSFSINSWSLDFMLEGAFGHTMYNESRFFYQTDRSFSWNVLRSSSELIDLGINDFNRYSDFFLENAGYVRMNYISISRVFDTNIDWLNKITGSFIVNNLFTITNYSGSDPAVSFRQDFNQSNYSNLTPGQNLSASWLQSRAYSLRLRFDLF